MLFWRELRDFSEIIPDKKQTKNYRFIGTKLSLITDNKIRQIIADDSVADNID